MAYDITGWAPAGVPRQSSVGAGSQMRLGPLEWQTGPTKNHYSQILRLVALKHCTLAELSGCLPRRFGRSDLVLELGCSLQLLLQALSRREISRLKAAIQIEPCFDFPLGTNLQQPVGLSAQLGTV